MPAFSAVQLKAFFEEHLDNIKRQGAVIFDVDETLAGTDEPLKQEMLRLLATLLKQRIEVTIISANTLLSNKKRILLPLLAHLNKNDMNYLTFYVNGGGTKFKATHLGEVILDKNYNDKNTIDPSVLNDIAYALRDQSTSQFGLSDTEAKRWHSWITKRYADLITNHNLEIHNSWIKKDRQWVPRIITTEKLDIILTSGNDTLSQPCIELRGAMSNKSFASLAVRFIPVSKIEREKYQKIIYKQITSASKSRLKMFAGGSSTIEITCTNKKDALVDFISSRPNDKDINPQYVFYFDDAFYPGGAAEVVVEDQSLKINNVAVNKKDPLGYKNLTWIGVGPTAVQSFFTNVFEDYSWIKQQTQYTSA